MKKFFLFFFLTFSFFQICYACEGQEGGREGLCAPDFFLKDIQGKTVHLSDFKGKVVFLNFWATWCEPCIVEIPALNSLNHEMKAKSFVMLTVSIDSEGLPVIEKFFTEKLKMKSPSFPVLLDTNQWVSKQYGTYKVPETYIIDKTGRITDKVEGIRDWTDTLIFHYLKLLSAPPRN